MSSSAIERIKQGISDLPISRKIVAVTLISSLVTLGILLALAFHRDWNGFVDRKIGSLETISHILKVNTEASLRFDDANTAKQYLDSFESEVDIARVCLFTAERQLFAQFVRDSDWPQDLRPVEPGPHWQEGQLYYGADILSDSKIIGHILIEMDTASIDAAFRERLWTTFGLLAAGLLLSGFLAWRMQKPIAAPIQELANVSRKVAANQDFSLRVSKAGGDEVGSLVESFNAMLEALRERDEKLLRSNSNLEKIVAERTEDLNQRNLALKDAINAANAANEAKNQFLATTSHELRTPLNPIIGYVDKLLFEKQTNDEKRELEIIKLSAESLLRLIDDILDFSRIEQGEIRLDHEEIDLQKFCRDTVYLMNPQAEEKGLKLSYEHRFEGESPFEAKPIVLSDEGRLKQIILNFVGNAIKFTNKGSVSVFSEIKRESGIDWLRIDIQDTGIGIAKEDKKKLFRPFSQIDSGHNRKYGGMGLGLAISSKLATALRGSIGCESEEGNGSRFWIRIPIELRVNEFEDVDPTPSNAFHLKRGTGSVLLVEDESVNRELGVVLLDSIGYQPVCAKDGYQALKLAEEQDFDLILLDIRMPGIDGFEVAKRLRERELNGKQTPIIAVSAHVMPRDQERCLAAGMNDSLRKPLNLQALSKAMDKWLGSRT